jgi:hypothetical protein
MMKKLFLCAAALLLLPAWCPPVRVVIPPAVHSGTGPAAGGGGSSAAGSGAVAIGIGVLAAVIIAHEAAGPACASRTKYNIAHGYDQPRFWRPLCKFKKRHHHHRPRDPARSSMPLWPYGK